MNNNEAIDQAIALLEKLRTPSKPRERWGVFDRDGDVYMVRDTRVAAQEQLRALREVGDYAPYSLAHITEVIE